MLIAADYPFMDVFWSMLIFFLWIAWILILFRVFVDIFRRHDVGGWHKAAWCVFVIVLPFLGVLVYLIAQGSHMAHRDVQQQAQSRAEFEDYVRSVAQSQPAAESQPPAGQPPQPTA